jgi:TPR repeat protein
VAKGKTPAKSSAAAPAKSSKSAKSTTAGAAKSSSAKSAGKAGKGRTGRNAAVAGAAAAGAAAAAPLGREHWTPEARNNQAEDAKELAAMRAAAQTGDAKAQYLLGSRYRFGKGVNQDLAQAVHWYRQSADQGYALRNPTWECSTPMGGA